MRQHTTRALTVGLILAAVVSVLGMVGPALADTLQSDSFIIQFGNFNVTAGEKSSASYGVTDTVGQAFAGPFGQYGSSTYFVGSGFQYIYQIKPFHFSISNLDINLGELAVGAQNTASNVLSITTSGAEGYTVYAYELHPLRHENGSNEIPDTTCDGGTCNQTTARVWTNANVPGFGFNATGTTVPSDFINGTYFRQFANRETSEAMQPVMQSNNIGDNDTATITYKAGISGTTAGGNYQTGVVFVAVPGY